MKVQPQKSSTLLPYSIRIRDNVVVVSILRPLTTIWFNHLKRSLLARKAIPVNNDLICDLSQVEFISALGLNLLLDLRKKVNSHDHLMMLACLRPEVRLFLDLTDLIPPDEIFSTVEEALRRLSCEH